MIQQFEFSIRSYVQGRRCCLYCVRVINNCNARSLSAEVFPYFQDLLQETITTLRAFSTQLPTDVTKMAQSGNILEKKWQQMTYEKHRQRVRTLSIHLLLEGETIKGIKVKKSCRCCNFVYMFWCLCQVTTSKPYKVKSCYLL